MTFGMPKRRLPHLRQKNKIWWCCDAVCCGTGINQKQAWNDWFKRRNLIDRMHRNEVRETRAAEDWFESPHITS